MKHIIYLLILANLCSISSKAQNNDNTSTTNEPLKNIVALCELFDLNYASFEEKNINWKSICQESQKRVSSNTSDKELFEIMIGMLKPLNDGHVTLKAKEINSSFSASRKSRIMTELENIPKTKRKELFKKSINNTLKQNGFESITEIGPKFRGEKLFEYTRNETIGYLRFYRSFSKLLVMNGPSLNKQLEKIFNNFKDLNAVIIDIRFNIGGDDEFSKKVAGRFLNRPIVGFYKQTRKNGEFGKLDTVMLEPNGKEAFLNKVVLLTNDRTVSAADVLALMMSQLSNVTIIGEPSNGSYSDLYEKKLPNGWMVSLSNQRYFSADKVNYEGLGTPVDILAKNTILDIENNRDSVLLKAIKFLNKK
jgi:hypothetical protein